MESEASGPETDSAHAAASGAAANEQSDALTPPVVRRTRAVLVLVALVALLAGFFGYVAMAPKGELIEGTLPINPVGFSVPDVRLPALHGNGEIGVRDFVGKPIVINFWASWCVTCKDEAAILGAAERKWRDRGVVFLGIDTSDQNNAAKQFEARYGMDYESLVDADGVVGPNWGVTGYPETFFVGRDGRIVSKFISAIDAATLEQRITDILNS